MSDHPTPNRLARESSPYLLQHAHNPVDWYPWGDEALRRARDEDRPILLSVGYSACHWCHVMERESFEDPQTAALMNAHFVCIKVDREERPDLDHIYQTAIQVLGRNGGWPLTMFLTPDLKPFFGGTYFPPVDRYGMRAFTRILTDVATAYREQRPQIDRQAAEITEYIAELDAGRAGPDEGVSREAVGTAARALLSRYEPDEGGFGSRPKFPNSTALELWLRYARSSGDTSYRDRVTFTVRKMIEGGIYDQIGGGFHRYSTDNKWLVPHFEKMLYDNALLLRLLAQLGQVTAEPRFLAAARETADYVRREMTDPAGGFYSTQDADSEGEEGRFFVWDEDEIRAVVGDADADVVQRALGVVPGGNFEHGKSILHRPIELAALGRLIGRSETDIAAILTRARPLLYAAREKRVHPSRDDKVIAGWNGLMIHGLAALALAGDSTHLEAAQACSRFVAENLWKGGTLLRTWRNGTAKIAAFAEDYAFLAEGELALFEATGDGQHFSRARTLADLALERFGDPAGGFFVTAADGEALIQRPKATYDNAVPSATSSMTMALLRLHALTGDGRYAEAADRTLRASQAAAVKNPFGFSYLLCALDAATAGVGTLVITGTPGDPTREALLGAARGRYQPDVIVVPWSPASTPPAELSGLVTGKPSEAAAFLCRNGTCSMPAKSVAALNTLLGG